MAPRKTTNKGSSRGAALGRSKPAQKKTDFWSEKEHLFKKAPKNFNIGNDLPAARNLSRYVKWPQYIRMQRQRAVLKERLRVPPAIAQFQRALDKNQAEELFKFLAKYTPETRGEKKKRLFEAAQADANGKEVAAGPKPKMLKYGLKHVTSLIEQRKAKLVIIAHDVDPIELVVWMPMLCREQNVPYCIVKSKSRLGQLVHQKTATCIAVTDVRKEDSNTIEKLVESFTKKFDGIFTDVVIRKKWGGKTLGVKAQHKVAKLEKIKARENQAAVEAV